MSLTNISSPAVADPQDAAASSIPQASPERESDQSASLLTNIDRQTLELVTQKASASEVERSRAHALLLMNDHVDAEIIKNRTGVTLAVQRSILRRFHLHGLSSVLVRSARKPHSSKYPTALVLERLRETLKSRPPEGSTKWDLRKLTAVVRDGVSGAEHISAETIRVLLRNELGIKSIRQLEPFWLVQVKSHQRRVSSIE
jgi:hypothetical protein